MFAWEVLPPAHWRACEPLFRAALEGRSSSLETERRGSPASVRRFDDLAPHLDADKLLAQPPGEAIDELPAQILPGGTEQLDDDVAVLLLNLGRAASADT